MKKRKLSCLLALTTFLAIPLAACDKDKEGKNVLNEHFYWENAKTAYSQVTRYDGDLESFNKEHSLAVIRSTEESAGGTIVDRVEVVNLLTDKIINVFSVENPIGVAEQQKKTIKVTLEYPVIAVEMNTPQRVSATQDTPEHWEENKQHSYYWAKESNVEDSYWDNYGTSSTYSIATYVKEDNLKVVEHYGLYEVQAGHSVYWVNEKLETLREFNLSQTEDYSTTYQGDSVFDGCYDEYLYSWSFTQTSRVIQVYNREGVCSMQYTFPSDVVALGTNDNKPVILNNGNLLVQECTLAEKDATDYTYRTLAKGASGSPEMTKFNVTSKIINYKTGEAKVVKLDYIVQDVEAAYVSETATNSDFPFVVRAKSQNQAYIGIIENKEVKAVDYVTLNNEGKVTYTVQNDYVRGMGTWSYIQKLNDNQYAAQVTAQGTAQTWIFDASGKKVTALPPTADELTEDYVVTEYGIYDYNRKCLYDFETSPFYTTDTYKEVTLVGMGDRICLSAKNLLTCEDEWYEFDGKDFVKAVGTFAYESNDDLPKDNTATIEVVVGNDFDMKGVESYTWTLYKKDGTPLLKKQIAKGAIGNPVLTVGDDVAYVEMEVDGEPIVYVVK